LTVKQFESLMKEDLLRSQLVTALTVGAQAPAAMARGIILRDSERRRVAYLTITDALAGAAATPTAEDLKAYYEANSSKFMAPEYRTFTVASVPLKDFVKPASEEELRKAYDAAKARVYDQPEKRTLYQLTYDSESAAQAAIAALNQGKPFEAVASEKGGSLSQATLTEVGVKDMLDPTVAAAAFSPDLIAGGVAGPIKSLFGWTVVQVAAVIPPSTKSFEEVREELAQNFGQQDARKKMLEKIDQLEEARDTGSGLASAAEQAGIILSRFGPVDSNSMASGGFIIPDVPAEVLAAAFKIQEGEESEAEALAADAGYFFVQVEDVTPPAVMPFDVVANDVENRWRADERSERIAVKVKAVKDELAKGATLEQEAAKVDRAVLEAVLTRNSESDAFSAALKDELFKSAPSVVLSGPAGLGSAQTVAVVREIAFNVPQAQQQVAGYAPYLAYQLTQEQLEAYVDALREDYRVRTDQNAVAQLFSESQ
jgi:peptidyl-prolyl cis-trans isomerase D